MSRRQTRNRLWSVIGLILLTTGLGLAQTIPVESAEVDTIDLESVPAVEVDTLVVLPPETVPSSDPSGFHYRLTADATVSSGNVNRALIQLGASLDWAVSQVFRFASTPSFVYGRQNGLLNEREWLADFRASVLHERRFYYLAFGAWEKSNLRRIISRTTGGAGVGFKFINRKAAYLSITNVVLYENSDFMELADVFLIRNSTRIFGEYQWSKGRYSLNHTVFLQPALNQRNFRWNGNLSFQVKMTATVSLRTTFQNSYESYIVPGRKNNDLRWTMGVAIEGK